MIKILSLIISSISLSLVYGAEISLLKITNQENKGIVDLIIKTDENGDIKKLRLVHLKKSKIEKSKDYNPMLVLDKIVLKQKKSREIVNLTSSNFSQHQGGIITLDYLVNGITGTRGRLNLDLVRDSDDWSVEKDREPVSKLHFISNKKAFVGTIGIKKIVIKN